MKKIFVSLFVLSFAAWCFAPIKDQRGATIAPEYTQEQVAQQQGGQQVVGVVGFAPEVIRDTPDSSAPQFGSGSALESAAHGMNSESARQNLVTANKGVQSGPNLSLLWAAVALALGVGCIFGLKAWANKAIPVPQKRTTSKPKW